MKRSWLVAGGIAGLLAALVLVLWLILAAPLYLLMPHSPRNTDELFGTEIATIAHRGASREAPENTLAAFRAARRHKAWIELDVMLCKTGEVLVIHDKTVDRTTDGTGLVADLRVQDIRRMDAGSWFAEEFTYQKVPTLSEVLAVIGPDTIIDIEMKTDDDKESLPKAVALAIERARREDSVFVSSFDPFMLEQIRLENPDIVRGQLVGTYADSDLAWYEKRALQNLWFTGKAQPDLIIWEHSILTETVVERLHDAGYRVIAWTVNEPQDLQRMRDMGVDGLVTDHPEQPKDDEATAWLRRYQAGEEEMATDNPNLVFVAGNPDLPCAPLPEERPVNFEVWLSHRGRDPDKTWLGRAESKCHFRWRLLHLEPPSAHCVVLGSEGMDTLYAELRALHLGALETKPIDGNVVHRGGYGLALYWDGGRCEISDSRGSEVVQESRVAFEKAVAILTTH